MWIARKDGVVYIISNNNVTIYENQRVAADRRYDIFTSMETIFWGCYCHFKIKSYDWQFVDYLPEPYRNWSSIDDVKNSFNGETILFEETWDIVTDNRQYLGVHRDQNGIWHTRDGKEIPDNQVRFLTVSESL